VTERTRTIAWEDPMIGARAAEGLSGLEYLRRLRAGELPMPPITALVGFRFGALEEGRVSFEFEPAEHHYNPIGTVHGGIPTTLLDSAMGCALHSTLPRGVGYATVELNVHFVRPIRGDTGPMVCEGRVVHGGRRHATAEARLTDAGGKLYAHATCSCVVSERDDRARAEPAGGEGAP